MSERIVHQLNLGAGWQSTFLYLNWDALGLPPLDVAIFADTQEEPQDVYAHLEWLKQQGKAPILVGTAGKLGDHLKTGTNSTGGKFASIPAYTSNGTDKGRTRRQCSREYKIDVINRVLRREVLGLKSGRSPKGVHVNQYIGISLDEAGRAYRLQQRPRPKYLSVHFPLVEKFLTRGQIGKWLVENVPHPVPRSACVFCPFHSDAEWQRIKENPTDWARAVEIDEALRIKGNVVNRNMEQQLFLHRSCQPLVQIDLQPVTDPRAMQSNLNFSPECFGVCGV